MTVKAAEQTSDVADKTKGTATFTGLTAGYYLVFPEGGSTGDNGRGTDAILVNVPKNGGVTEQTIKSTFPTVEKKVQTSKDGTFEDNGSAQVGDTVTFNLTAKVPDMTDYNTYKFVFHDTLSHGLAFDANSVKVTVAGAAVTKDTSYNKLKKPIKIEITVAGEAYTTPTYKVDEADQNTSNIIKVENVKGVMLPETGSIGTIGLTLLGVAVVLLGVFAPKKKKENR